MAESIERVLGRLEEGMDNLQETNKQISDQLRAADLKLMAMEGRMTNVENSLTQSKPVIDEFITIKTKVVGAGQFGKWVWVCAAALISFLIGSKTTLAELFNKLVQP
jgi:predicted phage tail protein